MKDRILNKFKDILKMYYSMFEQKTKEFNPGKTKIPLAAPTYSWEEVLEVLDCLLSTYITMGEKVRTFEEEFANYIGTKHAIMVNSGSSALLLAMSILTNKSFKGHIKQGEEIIVPAVPWSTTIFPIVQMNLIPVFVDINISTLNIDPNEIQKAISEKTKGIIPVHLLGYPCDMKHILEVSERHNLFIIEDACEAVGAEYNNRKVGSFGDIGVFSFFFSHHISTIEGGMIVTNRDDISKLAKVMRAHGWIRDLDALEREKIAKMYPHIDPRFLFINLGYNFRPTEIQGAFGIHQIKKLDNFIDIRRRNAQSLINKLRKFEEYMILPKEESGYKHVYFGFPIILRNNAPFTRKEFVEFLESKGIETRPIAAGNFIEQPVADLIKYRVVGDLTNSKIIMRNGLFIGIHHFISKCQIEYIVHCIEEFVEKHKQTK